MTEERGPAPPAPVRVGIGLIGRDGRYLVRPRPDGQIMAGAWEFPGGKAEPGEPLDVATARECREETGLEVVILRLRRVIDHTYPHGRVELVFFDCAVRDREAEPSPATGWRWVDVAELGRLAFPGANGPVLEELAREAGGTAIGPRPPH